MKKSMFVLMLAATGTMFMTSCSKKGCTDPLATNYDEKAKKDDGSCVYPEPEPQPQKVVEKSGSITSNETWTSDKIYILKGFVYVESGATLTIQPGTIIKGDKNSKGSLIIKRGAKIIAQGTASQPIVFTSSQPAGSRDYGDWGGVIICGKAPVNLPGGEGLVEGGVDAYFGGNDPEDNSGILEYVRIEYPGIAFQPNQEINGLTLAGVGRGTKINHVQVSYSGDDAFEFFGGTVNAKYLISYKAWDDDFDTDNGWSGTIQFAVALRDPAIADQSGSNGFESDNDGQGTSATPITSGIFCNVSIFGPKKDGSTTINGQFKRAAHIRRNSQLKIFNSLLAGFPTGLLIDGSACETNANNGDLVVANTIISGCNTPLSTASGSTFDINTWFNDPSKSNQVISDNSTLMVDNAWNLSSPNFVPQSGSPLLSGASFTHPQLATNPNIEVVSFRGAFGSQDWTTPWVEYNPQQKNYE
jgi:hypothetical protein